MGILNKLFRRTEHPGPERDNFHSAPPHLRPLYAFNSVEGLAFVVHSLIQEVEVLKTMLKDTGNWSAQQYKETMIRLRIADHNSAGGCPWTHHSYYRYTLDDRDFLKEALGATEGEIRDFEAEAEEVSMYT
jgi:hypothetical protein